MEKSNPAPIVKGPSLSDTQARDSFIAAALRELVKWQLAPNGKVNHDQAAALAVRYANSVMAERKNTEVLNVVVAKGVRTEVPLPVLTPPETAAPVIGDPPKSITEIIGEPDTELAEVK